MTQSLIRSISPEEQELDRKLADLARLESELIQRELEEATLQGQLQAFEFQYLHIVGLEISKLDDIRAQIAEAEAKLNENNQAAIDEAKKARAQAKESSKAAESRPSQPDSQEKFEPSQKLKMLYREVAKHIHPDLAENEDDRARRTNLMVEVNAAYKAGDESKLRQILSEWKGSPDHITGEDVGAKLIRTIRKIAQAQNRITIILSEIDSLKSSALYTLLTKIREAENSKRNLLGEMAHQLDLQISERQKHLANLLEILNNRRGGN